LEVAIYGNATPFASGGAVMAHAIKPPELLEISPYWGDEEKLVG
jgi:hypothetical protein